MSKYYLDIRRGEELIRDWEGSELPDTTAAQEEAIAAARELLIERLRWNEPAGDDAVLLRDDTGRLLSQIPLRSTVV